DSTWSGECRRTRTVQGYLRCRTDPRSSSTSTESLSARPSTHEPPPPSCHLVRTGICRRCERVVAHFGLKEQSLERTDDMARGTPSPHGLRGDRSLVSRRSCGYPSSSSQCTEICWEASTEISFIGRTVTNARLQNTLATPTAIPTDTVT